MNEIWATTNEKWEISTHGNIRRKGKLVLLKVRKRKDGYLDVKLSYKRFLIHRLVAIAFIQNPNNLLQVNHINGMRNDPAVTNLEWVDQFTNMKHAIKIGLFPSHKGVKNGRATITEAVALEIKNKLKTGSKIIDLSREYKVSYGVVANIKRGYAWNYL